MPSRPPLPRPRPARRRYPLACALLACALVATPRAARAQLATAHVVVDADQAIGATNGDLLGVGWNTGDLARIAPLHPPLVRIDSRLESAVPAPGVYDLSAVLERVARVRALGAEPLVVLYGMPAWLGAPRAAQCAPIPLFAPDGCNPNFVAPSDFAVWQDVIETVVRALATAPAPAYRFESWNEPDVPVFWHDTREALFATTATTHRAVQAVAEETGLPLEIGGPAASQASFVAPFLAAMVAEHVPVDFLSWHYYANTPYLGPDGAEGNLDPKLYEALKGINPNTTPALYGDQTRMVRDAIAPSLAASGLDPELIIDEWNLSAGGLDHRHDSNEGAAFVAGTLIEMERAGLDRAAYYRSISDRPGGDWGLIAPDGLKKPAWWVFRAFETATGDLLAVSGDDPASGLWARASRRGGRIDVLLSAFRALGGSGRTVTVELRGACDAADARVATIDAVSPAWGRRRSLPVASGTFSVTLADQSVAWVQLSCARPAGAAPGCLTGTPPRDDGAAGDGATRPPRAARCPEVRRTTP